MVKTEMLPLGYVETGDYLQLDHGNSPNRTRRSYPLHSGRSSTIEVQKQRLVVYGLYKAAFLASCWPELRSVRNRADSSLHLLVILDELNKRISSQYNAYSLTQGCIFLHSRISLTITSVPNITTPLLFRRHLQQ